MAPVFREWGLNPADIRIGLLASRSSCTWPASRCAFIGAAPSSILVACECQHNGYGGIMATVMAQWGRVKRTVGESCRKKASELYRTIKRSEERRVGKE